MKKMQTETIEDQSHQQKQQIAPLWRESFEHDSCGMGFVARSDGLATHKVVTDSLEVLKRLSHRGGSGSDPDTGDGAGILTQIPDAFFRKFIEFTLPAVGTYAVGQFFLPRSSDELERSITLIEHIIAQRGLKLLGWRNVPINLHACGTGARVCAPAFRQVFVSLEGVETPEMCLYTLRRAIEKAAVSKKLAIYAASFSHSTIVYKGMLHAWQIDSFYPDLCDETFESALAMVHSRYSTNTFPNWKRAQPCRYIAHNGEINTLMCVQSAMNAIESSMVSCGAPTELFPVLDDDGSDSMMFDNEFEYLTLDGRPMPQTLMLMMPGPWSRDHTMPEDQKTFYKYAACLTPPWDGPAAICFSDGVRVGATLDRNGLRPARWFQTSDGLVVLASEAGVLDIPADKVVRKGKLGPGQMLMLDTSTHTLKVDAELKTEHCAGPFEEWLINNCVEGDALKAADDAPIEAEKLHHLQHLFGWAHEDLMGNLLPMAQLGAEPIGAMGYDAPLAVLSEKPQPLFHYFKQLFAQVTNPPIDAIREECVTGIDVFLGPDGDIKNDDPINCRKIHLSSPVIGTELFNALKSGVAGFRPAQIPILFDESTGLEKALEGVFALAEKELLGGASLLILTDRDASLTKLPIPALIAAAGLHHFMIRKGLRGRCSMIVDSFEPREVHHVATLMGYGVKAVHPRGMLQSIDDLIARGYLCGDAHAFKHNLLHAIEHGILKVISKMGISCVDGYIGAQIFEAVGLSHELVDKYFTGTVSRIGGMSIEDIERETVQRCMGALKVQNQLPSGGRFQWKRGGEEHLYSPEAIHYIQQAVRTNSYELYRQYKTRIGTSASVTLRSLLSFKQGKPVPLDEVEPVDSIVKRFKTGAMSFGSLSQEAHECIAEAMNILGGRSNSGEGGEKKSRFGTNKNSAIKQIASGRFGVTGPYLASAVEIQIKMAQGAKPGEGGQLPGNKVYPWVAEVRNSTPGVGLISPPPHHDIYSIEDLAQLIFDLKNANPNARINVKLVSEAGVGTIAAGVAKGGADTILISGFDGGTGASPRTSIQHAGLPWELGLAESHQTLSLNGLRGRVRLETDGKLMTGEDIAVAALLGAEEFGFATLPLVAIGCVMMRVCNLDTCPVGVATQNPALRARFTGKSEYVVNLMRFLANDLREIMAMLGFRTIDEMVGHSDMLMQSTHAAKTQGLDLSPLCAKSQPLPWRDLAAKTDVHHRLFHDMVRSLVENGVAEVRQKICNTDRAVATRIGSFISSEYGGLPDGRIRLVFEGTAGQSFGAFVPSGLDLILTGESNDYLGKGLCGGRIVLKPAPNAAWSTEDNLLCGNVVLYGATSGELYIAGRAGERFCVRNSGAKAVCEGVGDHGCEYMTGGRVVILGSVGRNFAAGMSGGIAYVLDDGTLKSRYNRDMVSLAELDGLDIVTVHSMISKHVEYTGSPIGRALLEKWQDTVKRFVKVLPNDYAGMLQAMERAEHEGYSGDEQLKRAFAIKTGAKE